MGVRGVRLTSTLRAATLRQKHSGLEAQGGGHLQIKEGRRDWGKRPGGSLK